MPSAKHCYEYPRPAITADTVLIAGSEEPKVLLIQRKKDPFAKKWALPGGFVDEGETPEKAARRELHEECGVKAKDLELLHVAGDPGRDPRGWTVSAVYLGFAKRKPKIKAGDDAADAKWFPLSDLPELAFDHAEILSIARRRLSDISGGQRA